MESRTNRVDPSARAKFAPLGCMLRKEYTFGQFPAPPLDARLAGVTALFSGIEQVPVAWLKNAHEQWMLLLGRSSPTISVLLVPSLIPSRVSLRVWAVRTKAPSPTSSPLLLPLGPVLFQAELLDHAQLPPATPL